MQRANQHKLVNPLQVAISYDSTDTIQYFTLPRMYTWSNHHLIIDRDHHITSDMVGKWIYNADTEKFEIHFEVLRPEVDVGLVLEEIAFAETTLLKASPSRGNTRIYVTVDGKREYWQKLKHWTSKQISRSLWHKRDKKEIHYHVIVNAPPKQDISYMSSIAYRYRH